MVRVRVHNLFGYFDYDLGPPPGSEDAFKRLIVFYGLNGTGKTTILRLIYHLLSPAERAGHKTFVARTRFQSIEITLSDGTLVGATRSEPSDGTYDLKVSRPGQETVGHVFESVGTPPRISREHWERKSYQKIIGTLAELEFAFYYLADDRTFSTEPEVFPTRRIAEEEVWEESSRSPFSDRELRERESIVGALEQAMYAFNSWVSRQASHQSSTGVASTHLIYADVIKRIASATQPPDLTPQIQELRSLAKSSKVFEKYGLSSEVNVEPLIDTVESTAEIRQRITREVLAPYVEALSLRFSQLQPLYDLIDTLVSHLNRYLKPKSVNFSLQEGLNILSPKGDQLSPGMLSSGERHLLLITCAACLATERRCLFIVDEPEISLNVVWQRNLLGTLLEISRASEVQFLLASHSIALITQHREHVAELVSNRGE